MILAAFRVENHLEAMPEFWADWHHHYGIWIESHSRGTQESPDVRWLYLQARQTQAWPIDKNPNIALFDYSYKGLWRFNTALWTWISYFLVGQSSLHVISEEMEDASSSDNEKGKWFMFQECPRLCLVSGVILLIFTLPWLVRCAEPWSTLKLGQQSSLTHSS